MLKLYVGFLVFGVALVFKNINEGVFSHNIVKAMESEEDTVNVGNNIHEVIEPNQGVNVPYVFGGDNYNKDRSNKFFEDAIICPCEGLVSSSMKERLVSLDELRDIFYRTLTGEVFKYQEEIASDKYEEKYINLCKLQYKLYLIPFKLFEVAICLNGGFSEKICKDFIELLICKCSKKVELWLKYKDILNRAKGFINSQPTQCDIFGCFECYNGLRNILKKDKDKLSKEDKVAIDTLVVQLCGLINNLHRMKYCANYISENLGEYAIGDAFIDSMNKLCDFLEGWVQTSETALTNICAKFGLSRSNKFVATSWCFVYEFFVVRAQFLKDEIEKNKLNKVSK